MDPSQPHRHDWHGSGFVGGSDLLGRSVLHLCLWSSFKSLPRHRFLQTAYDSLVPLSPEAYPLITKDLFDLVALVHTYRQHRHENFVLFKAAHNIGSTVQQGCRSTLKERSSGLMSIMDQTEHLHSHLNSGRPSTEALNFHLTTWWCLNIPLLFNLYNHSNSSSVVLEQQE